MAKVTPDTDNDQKEFDAATKAFGLASQRFLAAIEVRDRIRGENGSGPIPDAAERLVGVTCMGFSDALSVYLDAEDKLYPGRRDASLRARS